jgi:hypothetical protein
VGIVVADIHHDIQSQAAVSGDRFVEGCKREWKVLFQLRPLAAGSQADGGLKRPRCCLLIDIHIQVDLDWYGQAGSEEGQRAAKGADRDMVGDEARPRPPMVQQ